MDNSLTPARQNAILDDALQTYPLAQMPRDLTADVMARIQGIPAPRPFRLTWNDFILALVLSLSMGAIWFSVNHLPPLFIAQIRKESILFYQYLIVNGRGLAPVLAFGMAAFFASLTIPFLRRELLK